MWCLERVFISTPYQECYKMCTEFPTQLRFKPRLFENEHNLLSKASSRLYILRVCKYFGYPKQQLTKLFDLFLLIMSLFYMN